MSAARQWLGSGVFTAYMFLSVACYAVVALAVAPIPGASYRVARRWVDSVMTALRVLCRLDYVVEGLDELPAENTVVLVKHSSAWETLAQLQVFRKQTWVIKRELLWAPFIGWVLPLLKPIAINRRGGQQAVQQIIEQGKARLAEGFWVLIYPEGTRVPVGETRRYGLSGALLAIEAERPIVPIAHNAGLYWPRRGWLKRPGTIRLVIGPPIETAGRSARDVNADAQRWIEATVAKISGAAAEVRPAPAEVR